MVTADEARRLRVNKSSINHQTYKEIYGKITNRIKAAAAQGQTQLEYRIPPFVPGRPLYDVTHAARYASEKMTISGFRVRVHGEILSIDWRPEPAKRPRVRDGKASASTPVPAVRARPKKDVGLPRQFGSSACISQKLDDLKAKLNW